MDSIDFKGILELDRSMLERFQKDLSERESKWIHPLLSLFLEDFSLPSFPSLPLDSKKIDFFEGIDQLVKKIGQATNQKHAKVSYQKIVKKSNVILWEYVELIENSAIELFQQIDEVSMDRWSVSAADVVYALKELLLHRIDQLLSSIKLLQNSLKQYATIASDQKKFWFSFLFFWKEPLDGLLTRQLAQTKQYIQKEYEKFFTLHQGYLALNMNVEAEIDRWKEFLVLPHLETNDRSLLMELYRLLKCLEISKEGNKSIQQAIIESVKNLGSLKEIHRVFRAYYKELKQFLFSMSIKLKLLCAENDSVDEGISFLVHQTEECQKELKELLQIICRYRLLLLSNDSNPYVSSRWGFSEWLVGPEPLWSKQLLDVTFSCQQLDLLFQNFLFSLKENRQEKRKKEQVYKELIDKKLHEMRQPLISKALLQKKAEVLVEAIKAYDELGSDRLEILQELQDILSCAMRYDWKYHVLHGIPSFHRCYEIHQGLEDKIEDPAHSFRVQRLKTYFHQIEEWMAKGTVHAHLQEVDDDVYDMKTYLQEFFATVQRLEKKEELSILLEDSLHKLRAQLLEYRYLFGDFLYRLVEKNKKEKLLRNQFLFADHYFESIEKLLNEVKKTKKDI